jgi:nitrogenase subunit NifH
MEGLSQLLHTIKLIQDNLNSSLELEGVILTMADYRTNLTNEVINEAREFFKDKIYDAIIPRSIRLSEAPGYGKPIILYDDRSHGADSYRQLSLEFLKHNNMKTIKLKQNDISKTGLGIGLKTETAAQEVSADKTIEEASGKDATSSANQ